MATQNWDVEFEKYIIFHRGIQEVSFVDNHLHVIYQDGFDQDLGDPLGDRITQAEVVSTYAAQVEIRLRALEATLNEKLTTATDLSSQAIALNASTIEMQQQMHYDYEHINEKLDTMFDNVAGISYDEDTQTHYVDLSDYSTTDGVHTIARDEILSIDGVELYDDGTGNASYYINPIQEGSKTTEAINDMISNSLNNVDGISMNAISGNYEVDLSGSIITAEQIRALFA